MICYDLLDDQSASPVAESNGRFQTSKKSIDEVWIMTHLKKLEGEVAAGIGSPTPIWRQGIPVRKRRDRDEQNCGGYFHENTEHQFSLCSGAAEPGKIEAACELRSACTGENGNW